MQHERMLLEMLLTWYQFDYESVFLLQCSDFFFTEPSTYATPYIVLRFNDPHSLLYNSICGHITWLAIINAVRTFCWGNLSYGGLAGLLITHKL